MHGGDRIYFAQDSDFIDGQSLTFSLNLTILQIQANTSLVFTTRIAYAGNQTTLNLWFTNLNQIRYDEPL